MERNEPCLGRNLPKMTTMKKAEALSAGITQAHSTPIELAKGILSAHSQILPPSAGGS